MVEKKKKIGILGYGHLGRYLAEKIVNDEQSRFELVFVWNRSEIRDEVGYGVNILKDLDDFHKYDVDLIIEVAHPKITELYGERFIKHSNYMIGSPTVLANQEIYDRLLSASKHHNHKVYVSSGAFWGAGDIKKMSDLNTLTGLTVTMKKHPFSLKLESPLKEKLESYIGDESNKSPFVLYEGPVRGVCDLAPNNVNTMAVGALAAHNLGFDKVQACLVADKSLDDRHLIEIEVLGPYNQNLKQYFKCTTTRSNPASVGNVTGVQTYVSFYNSLLDVMQDEGNHGIDVC